MTIYKKQRAYGSQSIRDGGGNIVDFQITNGEQTAINPTTGYLPSTEGSQKGFYICPLTEGVMVVRLVGQNSDESFTIPDARISAVVGTYMEEKCVEIISTGTTVTSCLIGWSY